MNDLLPTLAVVILFTWIASRYVQPFSAKERSLLWLSFIAHQLAGAANILITRFYYGYGDMMAYHKFGVVAAERLRSDFFGLAPGLIGLIAHQRLPLPLPIETLSTNSGSMQGIAAFLCFLLFDSLYAICALIAGLAFLSKLALYKVVREELPELPSLPLLCVCMLLPSALFWSCSLLKEPIAMIGLLAAVYGWHQLINGRRRLRAALLTIIGSVVVIAIKGYAFPALALAAGAWHVARKASDRGDVVLRAGHVLLAGVAVAALIIATGALLPQFAPEALSEQLAGLQSVGSTLNAGSNYTLGSGAGSSSKQAILAPLALLTALFRPALFDVTSPIMLVNALEMSLFLGAAILVPFRRGALACFSELVRRPFLAFCFTFVVVFGTCVGLGTTNMGTLSRYRMPLLPFFGALLVALLARAPARALSPSPLLRRSLEH